MALQSKLYTPQEVAQQNTLLSELSARLRNGRTTAVSETVLKWLELGFLYTDLPSSCLQYGSAIQYALWRNHPGRLLALSNHVDAPISYTQFHPWDSITALSRHSDLKPYSAALTPAQRGLFNTLMYDYVRPSRAPQNIIQRFVLVYATQRKLSAPLAEPAMRAAIKVAEQLFQGGASAQIYTGLAITQLVFKTAGALKADSSLIQDAKALIATNQPLYVTRKAQEKEQLALQKIQDKEKLALQSALKKHLQAELQQSRAEEAAWVGCVKSAFDSDNPKVLQVLAPEVLSLRSDFFVHTVFEGPHPLKESLMRGKFACAQYILDHGLSTTDPFLDPQGRFENPFHWMRSGISKLESLKKKNDSSLHALAKACFSTVKSLVEKQLAHKGFDAPQIECQINEMLNLAGAKSTRKSVKSSFEQMVLDNALSFHSTKSLPKKRAPSL